MHIGNRTKNWPLFYDVLQFNCCAYAVRIKNMSIAFISNKWETAMTSQDHVTPASLKQANKEYIEGHFLSVYISKSSAHPSLKLHTVNWGTLKSKIWKFDHDQTNSHRVINKSFGLKECWSYVNIPLTFEISGFAGVSRDFLIDK